MIPKQGDIIQLDLPEIGQGRRGLVLVLTIARYKASQMAIVALVLRRNPSLLESRPNVILDDLSVVLADQVKNIDIQQRNHVYQNIVPGEILLEVLGVISQILGVRSVL